MDLKLQVLDVYNAFDNSQYQPIKKAALHEHVKTLNMNITPDTILSNMRKAYSKGFSGCHFIDAEYLGVVGQYLEDVFGTKKHYISAQHVCKHGKVCLVVDTTALGVSANKLWSFEIPQGKYADFCYEPEAATDTSS